MNNAVADDPVEVSERNMAETRYYPDISTDEKNMDISGAKETSDLESDTTSIENSLV
jgi:hypothetical protein